METTVLKQPRGYRDLLTFYFLQEGTNQLLLMVMTTFLLKEFGAVGLPYYYVGNNLLFIVSQMFIIRWSSLRGHRFLTFFSKIVIALCLVLAFASPLNNISLFLVALFFGVYYLHSYQASAELIGQIFSLQQSRAFLARVFAAGTAGCIMGGLSLKFLADIAGFRTIFILAATNFLINDVLLGRLKQYLPSDSEIQSKLKAASVKSSETSGFAWSRSPNIRSFAVLLFVIAFFSYFSRFLIDFLFATNLSLFIPSQSDLAGFFGIFGATMDAAIFLSQTFLVGKIFQTVSVGSIFAARALLVTIAALVAFLAPSVYSISAAQFIFLGMTWTFTNPASIMLLEIVPESPRLALRRSIAMGESAAHILVGLFLIFLTIAGSSQSNYWLFLVVISISILLLFLTSFLNSACSATVRESLQQTASENGQDLVSLQFLPPEEACLRLSQLLAKVDKERRYQLIIQAGSIQGGRAALLTYLPEERSPLNLTAIFRILVSTEKYEDDKFLAKIPDTSKTTLDEIRNCLEMICNTEHLSSFIEALGIAEIEASANWVAPYLEHSQPLVRQSAMNCILRAGFDSALLSQALATLKRQVQSNSPKERVIGAKVMGALGLPMFISSLGCLADDENMEVAELALQGLAIIPSILALREISRRRESTGKRGEFAQTAWTSASQGRRKVFRVLGSLTANERDNAIRHMQLLSENLDFVLISRVLQIQEPRIREGILKFMSECRPEELSVISDSLQQAPDGSLIVSEKPLLSMLRTRSWKALFPGGELLGLIGGLKNANIADFLKLLLLRAWKEHILPLHPDRITQDFLQQNSLELIEIRATLLRLMAFSTDDPAGCLNAFAKSVSTDRYTQAVAQEFLEEKLGSSFLRLLSPFLCDTPRFPITIPSECHDLFKEVGLSIKNLVPERTNTNT